MRAQTIPLQATVKGHLVQALVTEPLISVKKNLFYSKTMSPYPCIAITTVSCHVTVVSRAKHSQRGSHRGK